eukprot:TRINITY_DN26969_c0_g1_i1.p1 TRINITY_DN26969_c0_g1~~TRINITY_DN26969_c0_g1_i1.p1  ORF type:complete len:433 (-),score=86.53 TRINITY_DN26969_c0_g1_i1:72-1370(-)
MATPKTTNLQEISEVTQVLLHVQSAWDVCQCELVCRTWRKAVSSPLVWAHLGKLLPCEYKVESKTDFVQRYTTKKAREKGNGFSYSDWRCVRNVYGEDMVTASFKDPHSAEAAAAWFMQYAQKPCWTFAICQNLSMLTSVLKTWHHNGNVDHDLLNTLRHLAATDEGVCWLAGMSGDLYDWAHKNYYSRCWAQQAKAMYETFICRQQECAQRKHGALMEKLTAPTQQAAEVTQTEFESLIDIPFERMWLKKLETVCPKLKVEQKIKLTNALWSNFFSHISDSPNDNDFTAMSILTDLISTRVVAKESWPQIVFGEWLYVLRLFCRWQRKEEAIEFVANIMNACLSMDPPTAKEFATRMLYWGASHFPTNPWCDPEEPWTTVLSKLFVFMSQEKHLDHHTAVELSTLYLDVLNKRSPVETLTQWFSKCGLNRT